MASTILNAFRPKHADDRDRLRIILGSFMTFMGYMIGVALVTRALAHEKTGTDWSHVTGCFIVMMNFAQAQRNLLKLSTARLALTTTLLGLVTGAVMIGVVKLLDRLF